MTSFLLVAIGGACGALIRYLISYVSAIFPTSFPYSLLLINLLGCFLIGFLAETSFFAYHPFRLFVVVGLLGGFTSFSSFSLEFWELVHSSKFLLALCYACAHCLGSLLTCLLGAYLAQKI